MEVVCESHVGGRIKRWRMNRRMRRRFLIKDGEVITHPHNPILIIMAKRVTVVVIIRSSAPILMIRHWRRRRRRKRRKMTGKLDQDSAACLRVLFSKVKEKDEKEKKKEKGVC